MAVTTAPRGARRAKKAGSVARKTLADFPDIAAQLHPELNGGLTAEQIIAGSSKNRWWVCDHGPDHVWHAAVKGRTRRGVGCPCCANQRASVTNSLATQFPAVAAQLHPELNGGLTADQIPAGSSKKRWWVCDRGPDHIWEAIVGSRTGRGDGCPCCSGRKVSVTNSLATKHPDVAEQLHPELNDGLTADKIIAGSGQKVWWVCDRDPDHVWSAAVRSRTGSGAGCPGCANQRVTATNSLATLFPEIAAQLHPELNDGLTADKIIAGSGLKRTWVCEVAPDHVWKTTVSSRTSVGSGCPHCCVTGRSKFELQVAALLREHTALQVSVDVKVTIPGHGWLGRVDLEIPELRILIDLDPAYWHKNVVRDQRKLDTLAMRDDRTYVRVREIGAPPLRGNVVEAVYCPEAFANALRPCLEALTPWQELAPTEVAAALAAADAEWSELLALTNEQFAKAA